MKSYWIHRISHCWDVSKPLLDKDYLTIGWLSCTNKIFNVDKAKSTEDLFEEEFDKVYETEHKKDESKPRNRWCLYRFLNIKKGDTVIVPLYSGEFAIAEVEEEAKPIQQLQIMPFENLSGKDVSITEQGLYDDNMVDIGFYIKLKDISIKKRCFASAPLQSRMKIRQTNGWATDLSEDIEKVKTATEPPNIHDILVDELSESFMEVIKKEITPEKLEVLIKWYMEKIGATRMPEEITTRFWKFREPTQANPLSDTELLERTTAKTESKNVTKLTSFTGYTPKNNKCFVYPYNYLYVTNDNGNTNILKYELFSDTTANFQLQLALSVGISGRCVPLNYKSKRGYHHVYKDN